MPASNAERFLSDGSDERALALKMFMGLTLSTFYNKTKFYDRSQNVIQHKSVTSGKSWQFIQIADGVDPAYHTPGTEMLGMDYAFDEGTITIDDPLVHHIDIPEDQLRMAHFDAMAPMVRQNARKIAEDLDKKMAIVGILLPAQPRRPTLCPAQRSRFTTAATSSSASALRAKRPHGPRPLPEHRTSVTTRRNSHS